jgi:hypothetical protein
MAIVRIVCLFESQRIGPADRYHQKNYAFSDGADHPIHSVSRPFKSGFGG